MIDHSVRRTAAGFWRLAGWPKAFPHDIEAAVLWALPLAVVKLPRLRVTLIRSWLNGHALTIPVPAGERELRACLIALRGRGIVFIDGCDAADEQRMSIAHEVAHFLLDYLLPREKAMSIFGPTIVPVLDGDRPATDAERLSAVLRDVTLGVFSRLWVRGPLGLASEADVVAHEDLADALALELLAPRREVAARVRKLHEGRSPDAISALLQAEFGVPSAEAGAYARVLCASARPAPSVRDWLGIE